MTTIPLGDAQARLAETIKRTAAGPIVLEDAGHPVAVVLSVEEYRHLSDVESRERARRFQEAAEQLFGPFARGEFREPTQEDWQALIGGERRTQHDPQSWALPPKSPEA